MAGWRLCVLSRLLAQLGAFVPVPVLVCVCVSRWHVVNLTDQRVALCLLTMRAAELASEPFCVLSVPPPPLPFVVPPVARGHRSDTVMRVCRVDCNVEKLKRMPSCAQGEEHRPRPRAESIVAETLLSHWHN